MKQNWFVVGCVLLTAAQIPGQERGGDGAAAIRRLSEQYAVAIRTQNATNLGQLLADGYSQSAFNLPEGKKEAIRYFTEPRRKFVSFKTTGVQIRVDGDTAIETGEVFAEVLEFGSKNTWGGIKYSRVWLKRSGTWRITHEHRG